MQGIHCCNVASQEELHSANEGKNEHQDTGDPVL